MDIIRKYIPVEFVAKPLVSPKKTKASPKSKPSPKGKTNAKSPMKSPEYRDRMIEASQLAQSAKEMKDKEPLNAMNMLFKAGETFCQYGRLRDGAVAYFMASQIAYSLLKCSSIEAKEASKEDGFDLMLFLRKCIENSIDTKLLEVLLLWMRLTIRLCKVLWPFHKVKATSYYYRFLNSCLPLKNCVQEKKTRMKDIQNNMLSWDHDFIELYNLVKDSYMDIWIAFVQIWDEASLIVIETDFVSHEMYYRVLYETLLSYSDDIVSRDLRKSNLLKLMSFYEMNDMEMLSIEILYYKVSLSLDHLISAMKRTILLIDKKSMRHCLQCAQDVPTQPRESRFMYFVCLLEAVVYYNDTKLDEAWLFWRNISKRDDKEYKYINAVSEFLRG